VVDYCGPDETEDSGLLAIVAKEFVLRLGDRLLDTQQVIFYLRRSGNLSVLLGEVASQFLLEKELEERSDIVVSDQEVERSLRTFRSTHQLEDPSVFKDWLLSNNFNDEFSFKASLELQLKLEQWMSKTEAEKGLDYFIDHKIDLDQLVVSRIVVSSKNLAEELQLQILEQRCQFETIAKEYSITEDAMTNGLVGFVNRKEMIDTTGLDLYHTQIGELIGPVECAEGWSLFRVDEFVPAQYDDEMKEFLRVQLFEEWLAQQVQSLNIDVLM
jgi:parvulin-like peptidyl-prolyl isomerase